MGSILEQIIRVRGLEEEGMVERKRLFDQIKAELLSVHAPIGATTDSIEARGFYFYRDKDTIDGAKGFLKELEGAISYRREHAFDGIAALEYLLKALKEGV